ncbi:MULTISPECIES: hypothetical protein [Geobacter]|uniref:Uncharacterized protein n=2 Tax=Geobacter TaxID=28231 RepID=A0A0C1QYZ1_9BACT|nr:MULTISPECIES: hypothetical protein [Geobacter]ANA41256.1 hypothetical protein A2G06_14485 [Geobacter anodireducens]KIE43406.1 hypothetical protein SE37_12585 [Geobacter soli]MBE2887802.1 hypothetical protein [Geobacter anodireducens]HMN01799.1 hypothetical protein [Geobacter anodireducens]
MSTAINDLVLVHIDNKPGFYARIEDVSPDVKPGWWRVKLLVLTVPLEIYTWILEEAQINGTPFTMGGTPIRMEKIVSPLARESVTPSQSPEPPPGDPPDKGKGAKIVSLLDRKKDK